MLASIIIPVYGHEGMTSNCLQHVLRTLPEGVPCEIIVVDDASPTPLRLPEAADPRVAIITAPSNLGFAGACNLGAASATGAFLLFLNNDTEPQAGWLDSMIRCADADAGIGIVGARLLYPTGTTQHAGVVFSQEDGLPRHVYRGFPGDHPVVTRARDFQAVTAACMLVKHDAFVGLGGFSTEYRNEFEDIDLCLRAGAAGLRVSYCPEAVVTHLEAVSRKSGTVMSEVESPDANRATFVRHWAERITPDELSVYGADGLLFAEASDVYPLRFSIDPLLGSAHSGSRAAAAELLRARAQAIVALTEELDHLKADNFELKADNLELQRLHAELLTTRAWRTVERLRAVRSWLPRRRSGS
jgi:GT2 family glycosyltransferase